jgi:hypothetical protein
MKKCRTVHHNTKGSEAHITDLKMIAGAPVLQLRLLAFL